MYEAIVGRVALISFIFAIPLLLMLRGMIRGTDTMLLKRRDIHYLAGHEVTDAHERDLYSRYLRRHHMTRAIGGVLGAAFAILISFRWSVYTQQCVTTGNGIGECSTTDNGRFSIGFAADPVMGDLLVGALTGIIVATLYSQSYRLAPDPGPKRTALLASRPLPPLPKVVFVARLLAILAIAGGAITATGSGEVFNAGGAYLALVLCGVAELTQRAITDRARPTSERAVVVDERLRDFAGRSVAWLELAAGSLALGWSFSRLGRMLDANNWYSGWLSVAIVITTTALLCLAIIAAHKSSGWPPRNWTTPDRPPTGPIREGPVSDGPVSDGLALGGRTPDDPTLDGWASPQPESQTSAPPAEDSPAASQTRVEAPVGEFSPASGATSE